MSVNINVGDNWQSKINANPSETLFIGKSGTHVNAAAGFPFVGRSGITISLEGGFKANGQGTATRFWYPNSNGITNMRVAGPSLALRDTVEVYNFVPPDDCGAIDLRAPGGGTIPTNMTIEYIYIHDIGDHTVGCSGLKSQARMVCRGLRIERCDRYAFQGISNDSLVEDCDVLDCGHNNVSGGNRGGVKSAQAQGWTIHGGRWGHADFTNYSPSVGIWLDIMDDLVGAATNRNTIECVELYGWSGEAIEIEISAGANIRNNLIHDTGSGGGPDVRASGIFILCSSNVEITGNVLYNTFRGITVRQTGRFRNDNILNKVFNVHVFDNDVYEVAGVATTARFTGLSQGSGADGNPPPLVKGDTDGPYYYVADPANNVVFENNRYHRSSAKSGDASWIWPNQPPSGGETTRTLQQLKTLGAEQGSSEDFFSVSPGLPEHPCTGEEPPPPPEEPDPPPVVGGPIPASVRVGSTIVMPVQPRF